MMKKNLEKILSFSFLFCIILFSKTFAENRHKVHEHGTSNITIAIENNVLQIQLEAPLMDIAGFEGEPKTKLQKQKLREASNKLKNWQDIFKLATGSCSKDRVTILGEHKKNQIHNHKNYHKKNEKNIHSDIKILYEFNCTKPNNFKFLEIKLFETFPNIRKINAQWTTASGQGQKVLNKKQNKLIIR